MARLQDYPQVTPGESDNLLIVQSQGQGLAPHTIKMDSANPTGTGAFSFNRKANTTTGGQSVAIGYNVEASGDQSFAEGRETVASGNQSHAEGYQSTASATRSHAEGTSTASGQHAHSEGSGTTAGGQYSHAEGNSTTASGLAAHAEGQGSVASNTSAHAEGQNTTASGDNGVHAEGYYTEASGRNSHSEGRYTIANHRSQHVFGEYNIADTSGAVSTARGTYVEIVGKGTAADARSNARTLDWNGNETIAGTLTQSSDERLKDIKAEDIPDVSAVKAVRFTWKADAGRDDSEHVGYIAQDVEKVLPFLVKEDAEGNKALDYIAFLVAKVDSLEKRLAELENK